MAAFGKTRGFIADDEVDDDDDEAESIRVNLGDAWGE